MQACWVQEPAFIVCRQSLGVFSFHIFQGYSVDHAGKKKAPSLTMSSAAFSAWHDAINETLDTVNISFIEHYSHDVIQ